MINKKEFQEIKLEVEKFDNERESLIKKTRDVIKLSKQIIFSIHRDDLSTAKNILKDIKKVVSELYKIVQKNPKLLQQGAYRVAIQEYVEALLYYGFVTEKRIYSRKEIEVDTELYLLGLCDLTGELVRRAIVSATKDKFNEALEVNEAINAIFSEMIKLDIRGGDLRKKYDSIKYDLKKMENLVLDLKLRGKI